MAGKRIEGERAGLTTAFARVIERVRPSGFVMENVPEVVNSEAFSEALDVWEAVGYHVAVVLVIASHLDVPQRRRRVFAVGTLGALTPLKDFVSSCEKCVENTVCTVRQKLPEIANTYVVVGRNRHAPWVRSVDRPAPTLRRNCLTRPNPDRYEPRDEDAGPLREAVTLTPKQAGIISGFPPDYAWPEKGALAAHVIGNAVCPPVMSFVITAASAALSMTTLRPKDEKPELIECHPLSGGPCEGAPRALSLLQLPRTPEVPDAETLRVAASRIPGLWIYRTAPTLVVRYRMGDGGETEDRIAQSVARCPMRPGWVFEVRQRGVRNSLADDNYWFVPDPRRPGKSMFFRSKLTLYRAGMLEGLDADVFGEDD